MNVVLPRVRALAPYPALFLGLVLVGLAILPPGSYSVDGVSMLAVADSLVTRHSFAVPCDVGTPGVGGACYSSWYPLFSIVMVPFAAVGRALASVAGTPVRPVETVVALVASLLAAAGAAVMTAILARDLGASRRATVAAAVGLYFGTELLTYSRTLFAEPLCALLVGLVTWGLLGSGRRRVIGHLSIPLLIHAKPQMILVGVGVAAAIALRDRSFRPLITAGAATCIGVALYFVYNDLRFGSPLDFGGSARNVAAATGSGANSPPIPLRAIIGVGVLLGSPGNGLLFYSPLAILGAIGLFRTRHTRVGAACLGGTIAVLAAYALQPYGNAWGTRYLVPALPLLAVGLTALRGFLPRLAVILACLTFVSQVPNLVAFYQRYYRVAAPAARAEGRIGPSADAWNPNSQLIGVWSSAAGELADAARTDPATVLHHSQSGGDQQALVKTVGMWWWMVPAVGIPLWLGLGVALTMLAAGSVLLIGLLRPPLSGSPRRR